jgi:hypothetical protein
MCSGQVDALVWWVTILEVRTSSDFHHCGLGMLSRNAFSHPLPLFYSKGTSINHPMPTTFESLNMADMDRSKGSWVSIIIM